MTHKMPRRGIALVMLMVCLALLAVMMTVVVRQGLTHKRFVDLRERRAQAYWLAQAGIEHAAAQLLVNPKYGGETLEIIPLSDVRVRVESRKDSLVVTSAAIYPRDGSKARLEAVD